LGRVDALKTPYYSFGVFSIKKGSIVKLVKIFSRHYYIVSSGSDTIFVEPANLIKVSDNESDSTKHYLVTSLSKDFLYKYPDYGSESIPITSTDTLLLAGYLYNTWTRVEFKGKRCHIPANHLFSLKTKKRVNEPTTLNEPLSDDSKSRTKSSSTTRSSSTYSTKGCSATQCTGTTQKGARCRNRTTNCNGRCYLH